MSTGGTVNYTDGFLRSGGKGPVHVKGGAYLQVTSVGSTSSINKVALNKSVPILPEASGVTGSSDSFYIIRGVSVVTTKSATNTFQGGLFETHKGHTINTGGVTLNDSHGVIFCFGLTKFFPTTVTFPQPIRLGNGNGLYMECYNLAHPTTANTEQVVTVFYSLIDNNT